ncbi:MAG: ABC transporter permease [Candidatus Sedimenticola sp. (ex Thyasira tokunagai)]
MRSRELIMRLVQRDINARYRQSLLTYAWSLILPVIATAVFSFLAHHRALDIGDTFVAYPVFALLGLSVWQLFAGVLTACTSSLVSAGALVTKLNFTKDALVFSAVGLPVYDFVLRLIPLTLAFLYFETVVHWELVFVPFVLLPMLLLALGVGFILSVLNLVIRDIGSLVGVSVTLGVFLAPVVYPPPEQYPWAYVNFLNPFSPFLIAIRGLITKGQLVNGIELMGASVFAVLVFVFGWRVFRIAIARIAERA